MHCRYDSIVQALWKYLLKRLIHPSNFFPWVIPSRNSYMCSPKHTCCDACSGTVQNSPDGIRQMSNTVDGPHRQWPHRKPDTQEYIQYDSNYSTKAVETNLCFRSQVWGLDDNLLALDLMAGLCSVVKIQEDTHSWCTCLSVCIMFPLQFTKYRQQKQ